MAAHQMLVLEAGRLLRFQRNPLREENDAMQPALDEIDRDTDRRPRRLIPGHRVNAIGQADDVGLLVPHPSPADHAAMDAVVDRALVLDVALVLPAVLIDVDEVLADERRDLRRLD